MKASKPSWNDLIIDGIMPDEAGEWLAPWAWLVSGSVAPVFMTKFGDWVLKRPDGTTEMLDVLQGVLTPLAKTDAEFKKIVNTKEWQDRCLLVQLIGELMSQGKFAGPRQCYAVDPHPRRGGKLEPQFISVSDILSWQTICAGICREDGPAEIAPR